jgi:hypothetical protein
LIALSAGEQPIGALHIGSTASYELVQKLCFVLKLPLSFDSHRDAFIEPARYRLSSGGARDQYVRYFVAQDIFQSAIGIPWGACGKDHNEIRISYSKPCNPWRNPPRQFGIFTQQLNLNRWSRFADSEEACDVGEPPRRDRFQPLTDNGQLRRRFNL